MADVAILTANYGGHDRLRGQCEQDIEVEWVAFSDSDAPVPPPWTLEVEQSDMPPNLAAKRYKLLPPLPQRRAIWIDANMEVTSPSFAREALAAIHDGLAVHRHPRRDCIYTEADASLGAESQGGKYADQPITEQVAHYRAEGHPEHAGLYAAGAIAWDCLGGRSLGQAWFDECVRWSWQDQLSLPVVCRRLGIYPGVFPFPQLERRPLLGNRWMRIHPHLA